MQSGRTKGIPRFNLQQEIPLVESMVRWIVPAQSTMDRWPLPCMGAHWSLASSRSDARELRPRGEGGEGRVGELNDGVTAGQEAVEGRLTGGGASAWNDCGEGMVRAKRRCAGGVGVFTEGGAAFYRLVERQGRPGAFNGRR
jgi:hypothetical protein